MSTTDSVVEAVREDLLRRSQHGIAKYGVTLERTDLDLRAWLQHAYEETLDQANYLKRAIMEIDALLAAPPAQTLATHPVDIGLGIAVKYRKGAPGVFLAKEIADAIRAERAPSARPAAILADPGRADLGAGSVAVQSLPRRDVPGY